MAHSTPPIAAVREGFRTTHSYTISKDTYETFLSVSRDRNPLHTDDEFARSLGFPEKVMHGSILNCFVSHFVGMHFPGGRVLLHAVDLHFKSPCHLHDEIRIEASVVHVATSVGVVIMDLVLTNATRDRVAAKGKVQVGLV